MIKVEFTTETKESSVCIIDLTTKALNKLQKTFKNKPDSFLRVKIDNGGCNGLKYGFAIENQILNDDLLIEKDDIKIIVNKSVTKYVEGSIIDYIEELQGSHFKITNPTMKNSCSCGSSFSI
ncbi:MAG: iron-sulfur cluster assembly accessory protein [Proteobacteria bacterium]|nr:iron-sulfur cluster assembly accessory protein [Pseudomonadota bacterium]